MAKKIEGLIEDVDSQIVNIRTKSLDVSFNELYDMYENEELIIAPDYQRLFRWEPEKQSRFIESLILEMPVPPIFVIETDDGIYELIDGLQRISSYLHFRGIRFGENKDELVPLELSGCDIVPDLNGYTFETLPKALQIKLKRSFVRMEVIKKESEKSSYVKNLLDQIKYYRPEKKRIIISNKIRCKHYGDIVERKNLYVLVMCSYYSICYVDGGKDCLRRVIKEP